MYCSQAFAWRYVRAEGKDLWYNWRFNSTQYPTPQEVPGFMVDQVRSSSTPHIVFVVKQIMSWAGGGISIFTVLHVKRE